jgi:hypothetical protein
MGKVIQFPSGPAPEAPEISAAVKRGIKILSLTLSEMMSEALGETYRFHIDYKEGFILITPEVA